MRWILHLAAAAMLLANVSACTSSSSSSRAAGAQEVAIHVTENGFEPERVTVKAGSPVTLLVTRDTDKTCATELVLTEPRIKRQLPLNQTVAITFTPTHAGELTYACGMDMLHGSVLVEPAR
jgi:plastocyanin domain-containing protein